MMTDTNKKVNNSYFFHERRRRPVSTTSNLPSRYSILLASIGSIIIRMPTVASSSSSSSDSCVLCPGGVTPLYPNAMVTFADGDYSCKDVYTLLSRVTDPATCVQLQVTATTACCGIQNAWSLTCDPNNDNCPLVGDGICHNVGSSLDPNQSCVSNMADCLDCDPCQLYHYTSCHECTSHSGCLWCPGDALCYSHPYSTYPNPILETIGSCPTTDDWMSSSCGATTTTTTTSSSSSTTNDAFAAIYTDPLYDANVWAYDLIHVTDVWQRGITGTGIKIRINDKGVDASHVELSTNFDVDGSCDMYLPADESETHGTACASIAAGGGNNSQCAVGIAPNAILSSCKFLGIGVDHQDPMLLIHALDHQDISSNSYGIEGCSTGSYSNKHASSSTNSRQLQQDCPFLSNVQGSPCLYCNFDDNPLSEDCTNAILKYCGLQPNYEMDTSCSQYLEIFTTCHFNALTPDYQMALTQGIQNGRDGHGLIFVWASGNENGAGANTNYQGLSSSRFIISVGAVGKDGIHATYSTPGASLFVSAPGGDFESRSNWITAQTGGGCVDIKVGTSFATPVVSGVIALMLQVNPNLGWRDVQGILAQTSQVMESNDASWVTNAAGFSHSYQYGFGIVDAAAAVDAATSWVNFGTEQLLTASSGTINLPIDDAGTIVTSNITLDGDAIVVESVVVYLNLASSTRGDLQIILISPQGTESILTPGKRPENVQLPAQQSWKLMTVRSWCESAIGTWTLTIQDRKAGDFSSCVDIPFGDDDMSSSYGLDCYYLQRNMALNNMTVDDVCTQIPQAQDACCFCGGGEAASSIRDQLTSWKILVYGHQGSATTSNPATDDFGETGTMVPTTSSNETCGTFKTDLNACLYQDLSQADSAACTTCVEGGLGTTSTSRSSISSSCSQFTQTLCPILVDECGDTCGSCASVYGSYLLCQRLHDPTIVLEDSSQSCSALECNWPTSSGDTIAIEGDSSRAVSIIRHVTMSLAWLMPLAMSLWWFGGL